MLADESEGSAPTHPLVVNDDDLLDPAGASKLILQVTLASADRETEDAEHVGRLRDLLNGGGWKAQVSSLRAELQWVDGVMTYRSVGRTTRRFILTRASAVVE